MTGILREKLAHRASPHLEPGEEIRQVFMATSGPSPYWYFLTYVSMFWNKHLIVVVSDRSVLTLRATALRPATVKKPAQITRYDRNMLFGPCSGLWARVVIGSETFHVHSRFHKDIARADADAHDLVASAGWYDDTERGIGQRYWDGSMWTNDRR